MAKEQKVIPILAYHSWRFSSCAYSDNDHLALAQDLGLIDELGIKVVPLSVAIEEAFEPRINSPIVAITFDDGAKYDVMPVGAGDATLCPGFENVLATHKQRRYLFRRRQPWLHATCFVIASAKAHGQMNGGVNPDYPWLEPDTWEDRWWPAAEARALLSIENHSWDHNHPNVSTAINRAPGDFYCVDDFESAEREIADAQRLLAKRLARSPKFFAYPWGHVNSYLSEEYLPQFGVGIGLRAAVTTEPEYLHGSCNIWRIPRFVCGDHWKSAEELRSILRMAR